MRRGCCSKTSATARCPLPPSLHTRAPLSPWGFTPAVFAPRRALAAPLSLAELSSTHAYRVGVAARVASCR
eukprot:2737152-Prymnesium_polylepis.1